MRQNEDVIDYLKQISAKISSTQIYLLPYANFTIYATISDPNNLFYGCNA